MEVRLSRFFDERIKAVDPARMDATSMRTAVMLVSLRGAIAEKSVAASWAKGTFPNPVDSLEPMGKVAPALERSVSAEGWQLPWILHTGRTDTLLLAGR